MYFKGDYHFTMFTILYMVTRMNDKWEAKCLIFCVYCFIQLSKVHEFRSNFYILKLHKQQN